ncbi:outer membrane protein for export and assembly of type 1 fimbriae [Klebsiella pneumoniae]|nr:outer membrane protein for export and assembly of type 1 fimbriae [Klebsiella pneumoniae]
MQLSVTQQLGRTATLYLSGSHQTYWGTDDADEQLQAASTPPWTISTGR